MRELQLAALPQKESKEFEEYKEFKDLRNFGDGVVC
jgi:hypothetical protein